MSNHDGFTVTEEGIVFEKRRESEPNSWVDAPKPPWEATQEGTLNELRANIGWIKSDLQSLYEEQGVGVFQTGTWSRRMSDLRGQQQVLEQLETMDDFINDLLGS